jgi:predicted  nucleic acid-binding Zn-ribbon protein
MPHQCVRCGKIYGDGDRAVLDGCSACGGRLFFYIKKEHLKQSEELQENLSVKEKKEIEKDILDLVGTKKRKENKPIILDFESIRILKPGKYELDLIHLFKKEPLVYKLSEGKYIIDLPELLKKK